MPYGKFSRLQKEQGQKKFAFKVHARANKPLIKAAVESMFKVKVEKVNCLNRPGKRRRVRQYVITGSSTKIAIVTLKDGYDLQLFNQAESDYAARPVEGVTESEVAPESSQKV